MHKVAKVMMSDDHGGGDCSKGYNDTDVAKSKVRLGMEYILLIAFIYVSVRKGK